MLKRSIWATAGLVALVVVAALLFVASQTLLVSASPANQQAAAPARQPSSALPQAAAPSGVEVSGTFIAPSQAALIFQASGRLTDVRVQEGAAVKKGDVLAVLDTTALQLSVQQAQAALAGAQAHLDQAKTPATDADTTAAQAAVNAAVQAYEKVRAGPTANDVAPLKSQVDNAKAVLDQAQSAYDRAGGASNPYIGMLPQSLQLQQATNNYQAALAAYNNALSHPTAAELAAAWGQVQQAQDALSRLQPTSANVAAAQAAVDQAQAALALAQQQLANATLTAPIDGTILWIGPHVGEMVGPTTPMMTIADLTHLQFQAGVDQSALEQIQAGQTVTITPDAFKDKTVTGKVSRIGMLATSTAGVINVPVTIDVEPSNVPLRPGLSATATIQVPGN